MRGPRGGAFASKENEKESEGKKKGEREKRPIRNNICSNEIQTWSNI